MLNLIAAALFGVVLIVPACARAEVLKQDPPKGALAKGQTVLVDDGSCPQGQIKEVTAANNRSGGRTHRCVPRP